MNRRQWVGWGGGAMAVAAAGAGALLYRQSSAGSEAAAALWAMRFERPEGGELDMAGLKGRAMLLNFWATWCAPCVTEMPLLDQFHRSSGIAVVGLAIDSPSPVREFLVRRPVGFPIGLAGMEGVEVARRLGNDSGSLPFSLAIDAKGRIVERKLGLLKDADLARWRGLLG